MATLKVLSGAERAQIRSLLIGVDIKVIEALLNSIYASQLQQIKLEPIKKE